MPGRPKRGKSRRTVSPPVTEPAARPVAAAVKRAAAVGPAEVPTMVVPSTVAQNELGRVFDRAMAGTDVAIAKHSVVRAFLSSAERYHELVRHRTVDLDALPSRFAQ